MIKSGIKKKTTEEIYICKGREFKKKSLILIYKTTFFILYYNRIVYFINKI